MCIVYNAKILLYHVPGTLNCQKKYRVALILYFIKIIIHRLGLLERQPKPQLEKEADEKITFRYKRIGRV